MIFFLVSFLSFLLLSKSLPLKPLPPWAEEMRLLSVLLLRELVCFIVQWMKNIRPISTQIFFEISSAMPIMKTCTPKVGNVEEGASEMTILDLPELVLECILGKLSPAGLCNLACVCSPLRDRCRGDHLWERHMREKWGRVIGRAARREWEWFVSSRKGYLSGSMGNVKPRGPMGFLSCVLPLSWLRPKADGGGKPRSPLPVDSIMSWYLALESGRFWFPAQVYNRENGHVGFMLSCYDAELSYDCHMDTFHASFVGKRYPPHGQRAINIEEGVHWDRLRAPPVDTPAHDLHVSDCLNDLRPGDHIEIQWRRSKEFPYGWWYGVVGHLESCHGNEHHCRCHDNDTVILEFNHYTPGSRWRQTAINRLKHREEGNETDGFYGGIRKILRTDEISTWRRLWPSEVLE